MNIRKNYYFIFLAGLLVAGCTAQGDDPGLEYAPQMYHSVPYDPLTQITDKDAGKWLTSIDDEEQGEFYNSNTYNPHNMNMRMPPANTVRRTSVDVLPYRVPADSLTYAAANIKNPLDSTSVILQQGMLLYTSFCAPCHGGAGQGDGLVGKVYLGVPAFNKGAYANMTEGHIFHVITHGKGRMYPYASQVDIIDRWKIVRYVQTLQQQ
jgi:mono/diheme cytochrome c family protein